MQMNWPLQQKQEIKLVFLTLSTIILDSDFNSFDDLLFFQKIRFALLAIFFIQFRKFQIEEYSAETWFEESISFDLQSSVSISSGSIIWKGLTLQSLMRSGNSWKSLQSSLSRAIMDMIVSYTLITAF